MMIIDRLLSRLTDNYNKPPTSFLGKLMALISEELQDASDTLDTIETYHDIDEAVGVPLDRIGRDVLEYRGSNDDERFREMIKTKMRANLSPGDIETLNDITPVFAGDLFLSVREMWNLQPDDVLDPEPQALLISVLNDSSLRLPLSNIERVVAGGIAVYWRVLHPATTFLIMDKTSGHSEPYTRAAEIYSGGEFRRSAQGFSERKTVHLLTVLKSGTYTYPRPAFACGVKPEQSVIGYSSKDTAKVQTLSPAGTKTFLTCGSFTCGREVV